MARTGDVRFADYHYMLQVTNNEKAWSAQQLVTEPPSLIKSKIDMVILAAPKMRQADNDVIATRNIATVLGELRTLADTATLIELEGLDAQTYNVMFDKAATKVRSIRDESGRITQYEISISCWDMYTV